MDEMGWEGVGLDLYRRAGADVWEPPGGLALARGLGVPVRLGARVPGGSSAAWMPEYRSIWLRRGADELAINWCVSHELAERELEPLPLDGDERERAAQSLAACLVAPRPAMRAAVRQHGHDLWKLAQALRITPSVAALRLGEVVGRPVALVTPHLVLVRGDPWVWPDEGQLRRLAVEGVDVQRIGPRRVALLAAG